MKKPACILWVAMLTMVTTVTTVFAQSKAGSSEYILVTNKTTNEPATINFDDFNNLWGGYECPVPKFSLGIYAGDEIEVSYGNNSNITLNLKPSLAWTYTIGNHNYDGGTSLSLKFTVPKLPSDNQAMQVEFDYQDVITYPQTTPPSHYTLNFVDKVVNDTRFYSEYSSLTHELRVRYVHFNDVIPYLQQPPVVSWYSASGGLILGSGSMDRNGTIIFDTKGRTGWYIVRVVVNGVTLPTEKILLY